MNLQEVQQLKQQIDSTNERLIYCKSQIESAKKRQAEILAQYNCKNYEEFNQLIKNKELEMENIEDRIIAQNDVYESLKEDVQSLLAGLSEADRELFYRRYILGERVEEIARRSGRNAAILYNRLSRGRKKLKRCIKESGIK